MDGISWVIICKDLSASYNGRPLAPTTSFSVHARAALQSTGPETYAVWRKVLASSSMTRLNGQSLKKVGVARHPTAKEQSASDSPRLIVASKQMAPVSPPQNVTLATVVKAAWALTQKHLLPDESPQDIVFGQVVSGRLLGIPHENRIVGPCLSIIPVRVRMSGTQTKWDLLDQVQQQHRDTMGCWNIGLDEIVRNCTSWPVGTPFGSFVRFQNFETRPLCQLGETFCQMDQIKIRINHQKRQMSVWFPPPLH
ncbi:hypothetical protein N7471_012829 [Penicillium samsonianum]|uniref:uncharacterized protein n=1 Tax=Penicillium samsonianum TaxID=1882272 RepID=UPI0025467F54|nr:uncharacterized protein N7471_012829 [Penicillium samsonianum]KAJ6125512.1 hypothetical protein N7471_012829 [Penicillium samsonianum]